jgi:hypothetical protein
MADHVVEMAVLGYVERVAVVGAQRQERRIAFGDDRDQRIEIAADRSFTDKHVHALGHLLKRLFGSGRFMLGADAGGEIAVEAQPAQQRCMAVDMAALEGLEFGHAGGVLGQHAGEVHEFGKTDHLGVVAERQQILDVEARARGLEMGGGHAARELHPYVHDGLFRAIEKIADAGGADDIGDLVRIADCGGDTARQDAAVKLVRGDQRTLDVEMRVDEAGHDDLAGDVDFLDAGIGLQRADDPVAANGDIALAQMLRLSGQTACRP